jgi:NAD-dependent deacetylase sirtuin 3
MGLGWTLLTFVVFQVEPFASLSEAVRSTVPRLLINRDLVGPFAWHPRSRDVAQLGDLVRSVETLVGLLGWTEELQALVQRETGKVQTTELWCLAHQTEA